MTKPYDGIFVFVAVASVVVSMVVPWVQATDELLERWRRAFAGDNRNFEQDLVNEYAKRGFF